MKPLKLLAALALAILLLPCCSKNETPSFNQNDLIGSWQLVWTKGYQYSSSTPECNTEWDEEVNPRTTNILTFYSDGTGTLFRYFTTESPFTWIVKEDRLFLNLYQGKKNLKLEELNDSELIFLDFTEIAGSEYMELQTYVKL